MTAWIVVESMFGNTREIADELAESLRERMQVEVWNVEDAPHEVRPDVALIVVGGPTHAFGMSRESTRKDAVRHGATASPAKGIREFLGDVGRLPRGLPAAAFDTRVHKRFVPGSAARAATRRLTKAGGRIVAAPESFYVEDIMGPLLSGEAKRARELGVQIIQGLERTGQFPQSA